MIIKIKSVNRIVAEAATCPPIMSTPSFFSNGILEKNPGNGFLPGHMAV